MHTSPVKTLRIPSVPSQAQSLTPTRAKGPIRISLDAGLFTSPTTPPTAMAAVAVHRSGPTIAPLPSPKTMHAAVEMSVPAVAAPRPRHNIFVCPEESLFYSQCLERLLARMPADASSAEPAKVVEFGAGDGGPVIECLLKSKYQGAITGFELSPASHAKATARINELGLQDRYQVHNGCFFKGAAEARKAGATTLIANPPYIPAPDNDILMPSLHGGDDGGNLTRDLLSLGFDNAMMLIAAYSNPIDTINHATSLGYAVTDFLVTPMPFGTYSSEPKVRAHIERLKAAGKAFYSANTYFLAGVLFQKKEPLATGTPASSASFSSNSSEDFFDPATGAYAFGFVEGAEESAEDGSLSPNLVCRVDLTNANSIDNIPHKAWLSLLESTGSRKLGGNPRKSLEAVPAAAPAPMVDLSAELLATLTALH